MKSNVTVMKNTLLNTSVVKKERVERESGARKTTCYCKPNNQKISTALANQVRLCFHRKHDVCAGLDVYLASTS